MGLGSKDLELVSFCESALKIVRFLFALYVRTGFASTCVSVIVKVLKFFAFNLLPFSSIQSSFNNLFTFLCIAPIKIIRDPWGRERG